MSDPENVAVLASILGRLEKTIEQSFGEVHGTLGDHGKRLTFLEEREVRRDERERAEDRIRAEFERQRAEQEEHQARSDQFDVNHKSLTLYGWQLWVALVALLITLLGVGVSVAQLVS